MDQPMSRMVSENCAELPRFWFSEIKTLMLPFNYFTDQQLDPLSELD